MGHTTLKTLTFDEWFLIERSMTNHRPDSINTYWQTIIAVCCWQRHNNESPYIVLDCDPYKLIRRRQIFFIDLWCGWGGTTRFIHATIKAHIDGVASDDFVFRTFSLTSNCQIKDFVSSISILVSTGQHEHEFAYLPGGIHRHSDEKRKQCMSFEALISR